MSVLGPTLVATLATSEAPACIAGWCEYLEHHIHSEGEISDALARHWRRPALASAKVTWLANAVDDAWLRIVHLPEATPLNPFDYSGWLSLETLVEGVDGLRTHLDNGPFDIIGEPADLDISPDIRAMQVQGPAGEVLYLTEVKKPVPGFDLPLARCAVDRLFIPVLLSPDRSAALQPYEQFEGTRGNPVDTRITVINRARSLPLETRHPIATVQLKGKHLIEVDELDGLGTRPGLAESLPSGIAMISFAIESANALPASTPTYPIEDGPYAGRTGALLQGNAGELIELIAPA